MIHIFFSLFWKKKKRKSKMLLFLVGKEKHGIIFPCPFQSSSFFWGRSVRALYYCSLDRRLLLSNRLFIVQRIRTHEHMDQIQLLLRGQNVPLCVKRQTWMNTQSDLFSSTQATQPVNQIRTDSDFEYRLQKKTHLLCDKYNSLPVVSSQ